MDITRKKVNKNKKRRDYDHQRYWNDKEYRKELSKKWSEEHPGKGAEYMRSYRNYWKKIVFDYYGNKCACPKCPETNPLFLTIDHIFEDGYKDKNKNGRRYGSAQIYRKIAMEDLWNRFQLLCYNCNCCKAKNNGTCPHLL